MIRNRILVIGAGPVGLFTAWTISRATGNNVEVLTISNKIRNKYSVNINGVPYESGWWEPQFVDSIDNYDHYCLIIIAKPYRLVHKLLLENTITCLFGKIKILVLSSLSMNPTNYTYSNYVSFGWPNISVEIDANIINSTGIMQLELWNDMKNDTSIKLKNTICSFGINTKCMKNLNYFKAKSMLTYATYIVLIEKNMSFTHKSEMWREIVFKQCERLSLDIDSVEQMIFGGSIKTYSLILFKQLHTYMTSNNQVSEAINFNILMQDKSRFLNYIKDYEAQQIHNDNIM